MGYNWQGSCLFRHVGLRKKRENKPVATTYSRWPRCYLDESYTTIDNNDGEALLCDAPVGTNCSGAVIDFILSHDGESATAAGGEASLTRRL